MPQIFESRLDAGRRLARALDHYRGASPLVLAISRGAVPIGATIAGALGGDLDVALVRKPTARAPADPRGRVASRASFPPSAGSIAISRKSRMTRSSRFSRATARLCHGSPAMRSYSSSR